MRSANGESFEFFHKSPQLLRKATNRRQRQKVGELEAEFRAAATEHADVVEFHCLPQDVRVSVQMNVYGLQAGGNPQLPTVIKAYIDALKTIAFEDDDQIAHLQVSQAPWEHPMMGGIPAKVAGKDDSAAVHVTVEKVESYTDRFDRAFRDGFWRRGPTPWKPDWGIRDETKLIAERRKSQVAEITESGALRQLEERKLRDGFYADIDRPGALLRGSQAIHSLFPLRKMHHALRMRSGSMMTLPLRGEGMNSGSPWEESRDLALDEFLATRPGLPFEGFVALDIAVRGESIHGKDLDNLAHLLLVPIEEKLCVHRGTIVAYRVYAAEGEPEGIQLRIIDSNRLLRLDTALMTVDLDPPLLDRLESWTEKHR